MIKRMIMMPSFIALLLLAGCIPALDNSDEEVIQDSEEATEETVIIPEIQLKDDYYRTLLPFKKSASRGLIVNNLNTKYDIREAEEGLLRLIYPKFSTENHFFQEGQYIKEDLALSWIRRQSEYNPDGLNPEVTEEMTDDEIAEKAPIYLAHIVEQNSLSDR